MFGHRKFFACMDFVILGYVGTLSFQGLLGLCHFKVCRDLKFFLYIRTQKMLYLYEIYVFFILLYFIISYLVFRIFVFHIFLFFSYLYLAFFKFIFSYFLFFVFSYFFYISQFHISYFVFFQFSFFLFHISGTRMDLEIFMQVDILNVESTLKTG